MKRKITMIVSVIVLALVVVGGAFSLDMYRMKNNKPVVFSAWGYDYAPPEEEQNDYPIGKKHSFLGTVTEETTNYMIVEPIVVYKTDDIEIPKDAEGKVKVLYENDHYDYLYGTGRRVVIYYDSEPYKDDDGITTIKTEDISTEGFREFKITVETSAEKKKRLIAHKTPVTDSSQRWWTYGDAALYYYGLDRVDVTIKGWSSPLEWALEKGLITLNAIIAKCNKDVSDGVIEEISYKDGGSSVFMYRDYNIIKYHTIEGNRDVYIGSPDMDIKVADPAL